MRASMLTAGDILDGRYQISALIAAGGMGQVFRARRIRLGDDVAIKVIRHTAGDDPELHERFISEGRTCAALRHPSIVSVLDVGIDREAGPFLVMEFLNGPSLSQEIAAGPLPLDKVCRITTDLASALDLAHSRGLVHRDLKPGNIVAHRYDTGDVVYKIVDFGIGIMRNTSDATTRMDVTGRIMGTLAYASPEQLSGETVDGRSDIYSFGVVVFEMLTGRPPFVDSDGRTLLTKQLLATPPRPSDLRTGLDAHVDEVVLKALAKEPDGRWNTATAFARAIAGLQSPTGEGDALPAGSGLRGRYDLGEMVAKGRLGSEVYAATHRAIGTPVAIRIMRRGANPGWEAGRARFLREARTMQVPHPSVLHVRDFGEEADIVYVVTDFISGSSLREVLDREGSLPWDRGRRLVLDVISGSHALHRRGALTFGLTPDILRVTRDGTHERLIISSAGIAEVQDVLASASEEALRGLQLSDNSDLFYVGPEVLLGEQPDGRTDVYTIGVIAYEIFTGRRPFAAATVPQLMARIFAGDFEDARALAPGLPADAAGILARCLARRPDQRYADAAELEAAWLATPS
jgi:serine/threonine protein kinase